MVEWCDDNLMGDLRVRLCGIDELVSKQTGKNPTLCLVFELCSM